MGQALKFAVLACAVAMLLTACRGLPVDAMPEAQMVCEPRDIEGLRVTFLGTATVLIDDGDTALLVDGFFSRPPLRSVLFAPLRPDPERIADALQRAGVCRLAAVMVAHAHYDHAMDAPLVARLTGATLLGGASVTRIGEASGLRPDEIDRIDPPAVRHYGRFEVEALASLHAPRPMFAGPVGRAFALPARVWHYREGENLGFRVAHPKGTVIVQASANFLPGMYENKPADLVLLSVGLLGQQSESFAREYWEQVVLASGARVVVPIHWDDFTRPLDPPLRRMPYDRVPRALELVDDLAARSDVELRRLDAFESLQMPLGAVTPRGR